MKIFMPTSLVMFFLGLGWGLYKIFVLNVRYGPTSAMLMTISVVVFLLGLVSEQVTQLRFDHLDRVGKPSEIADSTAPIAQSSDPQ